MIPFGVPAAALAALSLLPSPFAFFQSRRIGPFVANVTIEEHHVDELVVTDHPVERNATISDHAYKRPEIVRLKVGYSNSSLLSLLSINYINQVYANFLALQESLQPFTILTGKRVYRNMLITRLSTTTDEKTENALLMDIDCREVILVDTQVVTLSQPGDQKFPSSTVPATVEGTKQPISSPPGFSSSSFTTSVPGAVPGFSAFQVPIATAPVGWAASVGATPIRL